MLTDKHSDRIGMYAHNALAYHGAIERVGDGWRATRDSGFRIAAIHRNQDPIALIRGVGGRLADNPECYIGLIQAAKTVDPQVILFHLVHTAETQGYLELGLR